MMAAMDEVLAAKNPRQLAEATRGYFEAEQEFRGTIQQT